MGVLGGVWGQMAARGSAGGLRGGEQGVRG